MRYCCNVYIRYADIDLCCIYVASMLTHKLYIFVTMGLYMYVVVILHLFNKLIEGPAQDSPITSVLRLSVEPHITEHSPSWSSPVSFAIHFLFNDFPQEASPLIVCLSHWCFHLFILLIMLFFSLARLSTSSFLFLCVHFTSSILHHVSKLSTLLTIPAERVHILAPYVAMFHIKHFTYLFLKSQFRLLVFFCSTNFFFANAILSFMSDMVYSYSVIIAPE